MPVYPAPEVATPPVFLRDYEVARELNISKTKAYLMMVSGQIPGVVRFGRCIRVHRETLLTWASEQAAKNGVA